MNAEIEALEKLVRSLVEDHQRLLECIRRKSDAVRTADIQQVTQLVELEQGIIQRITTVERHRATLVQKLTPALKLGDQQPATLMQIAEAVSDEQLSTRLLALAAQLRDVVAEVRRESSIVRAAAEALARHMSGVMQTVHSALSRAGVYGQRGRVAMGAQLEFSIDIKS